MSLSAVESGTFGSKAASCGRAIVDSAKWCGREISAGFKSHVVPAIRASWSAAVAFLSTGVGAGIACMLLGFGIISYASSKNDSATKIALDVLGILFIGVGIFSIVTIGPAALI